MKITCDFCPAEITEPGGLLFSPPCDGACIKLHICTDCYQKVMTLRRSPHLARALESLKTLSKLDHKISDMINWEEFEKEYQRHATIRP